MNLDKHNTRRIMFIVAFGILLFMALMRLPSIISAIGTVLAVISPITLGLCMAFVLNIIMNLFEKRVFAFMKKSKAPFIRKLCRPISLVVTFVVGFGVIALVLVIVIPQVVEAVNMVISKLPVYTNDFFAWADKLLSDNNISMNTIADWKMDWKSMVDKGLDFAQKSSSTIVDSTIAFTSSVISGSFEVVVAIIISIYVLLKKERILDISRKVVTAYMPEKVRKQIFKIGALSYKAFSQFIKGQGIEACILGTLCFIGMKIFKFPYAGTVGVLVGVTALIPMFGAWIGGGLSAFLIFMVDPMKALFFLIYLLVLQQIENNLIYPRVVGESIGLPGLLVMVAVIIGNSLTGVVGILISVPLCSILYTLIKEGIEMRLKGHAAELEKSEERIEKS
jgi:predicted PurR-regulated permease PerM